MEPPAQSLAEGSAQIVVQSPAQLAKESLAKSLEEPSTQSVVQRPALLTVEPRTQSPVALRKAFGSADGK